MTGKRQQRASCGQVALLHAASRLHEICSMTEIPLYSRPLLVGLRAGGGRRAAKFISSTRAAPPRGT